MARRFGRLGWALGVALLCLGPWACGEPEGTGDDNNSTNNGTNNTNNGTNNGGGPTFTTPCPDAGAPRPLSLPELPCARAFTAVASRPNTALFANVSTAKFIIDLQDEGATYFIDSQRYDLHYYFCRDHLEKEGLDPVGTHAEFNERQYRRENRRFILGTLSYYSDQDIIALEFATGDTINVDQIRFAFHHLASKVYFGDELVLRPISGDHEVAVRAELEDELPVIYTDELFAGITYQPLNPARSYGWLRVIEPGGSLDGLRPTDIAVLEVAPNDIPPLSGIITQTFQTPLSHVNVLSQNRGTPNMALKGALSDPTILGLKDQLVSLEVTPQRWTLEPATPDEAEAYWEQIRPSETFLPPLDLTERGLPDLAGLGVGDVDIIGAKGANMAEMFHVEPPIPLPHMPFAIPFAHYRDHMERHGLQARAEALVADPRFGTDLAWRARELEALREAIEAAPMSLSLKSALHNKVLERYGMQKVRMRSSTNSEDLPGFNGAGLYSSVSAQLGDEDKGLEQGVKYVWASLWNDRAVGERDFYRIDHSGVAIAVLVHPSFPNEAANGVAFTVNRFNPRRPGQYVNVQDGEAAVTNPGPGELSEQFILYTWYEEPEVEYLSRSNLVEGEVLSWPEILELSEALARIHQHFKPIYNPTNARTWGMDVEFKFLEPDRRLLIKQARPINE